MVLKGNQEEISCANFGGPKKRNFDHRTPPSNPFVWVCAFFGTGTHFGGLGLKGNQKDPPKIGGGAVF